MWYIYNGILSSREKEEPLAICDNMDGPWRHYAKWISQTEKNKYFTISLTYGIRKKNLRNRMWSGASSAWGLGRWGDLGPRVQTSSYYMNIFLKILRHKIKWWLVMMNVSKSTITFRQKVVYAYIYTYIYTVILVITRNEILLCAIIWINLENIVITEISQTKNILYYFTY